MILMPGNTANCCFSDSYRNRLNIVLRILNYRQICSNDMWSPRKVFRVAVQRSKSERRGGFPTGMPIVWRHVHSTASWRILNKNTDVLSSQIYLGYLFNISGVLYLSEHAFRTILFGRSRCDSWCRITLLFKSIRLPKIKINTTTYYHSYAYK